MDALCASAGQDLAARCRARTGTQQGSEVSLPEHREPADSRSSTTATGSEGAAAASAAILQHPAEGPVEIRRVPVVHRGRRARWVLQHPGAGWLASGGLLHQSARYQRAAALDPADPGATTSPHRAIIFSWRSCSRCPRCRSSARPAAASPPTRKAGRCTRSSCAMRWGSMMRIRSGAWGCCRRPLFARLVAWSTPDCMRRAGPRAGDRLHGRDHGRQSQFHDHRGRALLHLAGAGEQLQGRADPVAEDARERAASVSARNSTSAHSTMPDSPPRPCRCRCWSG